VKWQPEIMYNEEVDNNPISRIPFIPVPRGESMPKVLFLFESRETNEKEAGPDGVDYPVVQWDLHQYADMNTLKDRLPADVFDQVRAALDLEPLDVAAKKGEKISKNLG